MLRFLTAGESHGPELVTIVEGVPAGFAINLATINRDLARRQKGYGRGGRMLIEKDEARPVSGIRFGKSLGSPITLIIENRDFKNWVKRMSIDPADRGEATPVTRARPGHADLAGVLKYNLDDIRDVLERASARETTARVAIGGLVRQILSPFGIDVLGYVATIGATDADTPTNLGIDELRRITEESQVRVADAEAEKNIIAEIDECKKAGDTLGGIVEVIVSGLPVGLGSHVHWDRKLDGRLAHALLSLQAAKGVELGLGFTAGRIRGSALHDEIGYDAEARRFTRHSNNSGGTEGGMSTGEPLRVRVAFKPLSTLMRPLRSVDIKTKAEAVGAIERSDVCAIPAAAVIAEAVVAFEIAAAFLDKFGGDSLTEIARNLKGFQEQVRNY
ncbi:MAG: chorismate synthase [Candidatus Binatus sp.]|uniref:chorismate synthase n=1 Tax=Candidatus Binatus sp. TaxID=2811406 RepID=UPI002728021A|nr:chorismate synthase [Candidatus Binatus sp.]MDO8433567.1 chorismate synthase [Candidatus Binatus sp.]